MRLLVLGSCALFLGLPGYAQNDLKSDLLSVPHASTTQVAAHLKALSEKTHEPSNFAVDVFARDLAHALGLKSLSDAEVTPLVTEIKAVFKSAGTSTVGFLDHVANFKAALHTIGVAPVDIAKLGGELETIGKQVRGPEDTPVELAPARRR
jgi:hypothetical protein